MLFLLVVGVGLVGWLFRVDKAKKTPLFIAAVGVEGTPKRNFRKISMVDVESERQRQHDTYLKCVT